MSTNPNSHEASGSDQGRRIRARGDGTVYRRKDGRWEAAGYVLDHTGTRRRLSVYARSRREALDKLTDAIATSNHGTPVLHATGSLGAYLDYWLNTVAAHRLRPTTHTRYAAVARLYLQPGLGRKKLAKLTARDVRAFLDTLRIQCQCCARKIDHRRPADQRRCCAQGACCQQRLNPLTMVYVHSVLKSALEHAVREEEIPRNVARQVRTGTPRPRRIEPLTADEARQLLKGAESHPLHALIHLALHTGLRRGELLALRWSDLDLEAGTAVIRRTLQRTSRDGLVLLPTKTKASERRLALPAASITLLHEHRRQQHTEQQTAGINWTANGYVFTGRTGKPVEPSTLNRRFARLLCQAGLRRIRFHDLRHSTATLLLDEGVELIVIKELLGHAHIGVTATAYAHVRLRIQRDAINPLSNAINDSRPSAKDGPADCDPPESGILDR